MLYCSTDSFIKAYTWLVLIFTFWFLAKYYKILICLNSIGCIWFCIVLSGYPFIGQCDSTDKAVESEADFVIQERWGMLGTTLLCTIQFVFLYEPGLGFSYYDNAHFLLFSSIMKGTLASAIISMFYIIIPDLKRHLIIVLLLCFFFSYSYWGSCTWEKSFLPRSYWWIFLCCKSYVIIPL